MNSLENILNQLDLQKLEISIVLNDNSFGEISQINPSLTLQLLIQIRSNFAFGDIDRCSSKATSFISKSY